MKCLEYELKKEINENLGSRIKIEELFNKIPEDNSKIIMNFDEVQFMGISFAQEYLNQKHNSSFEIVEINIPDKIKEVFNLILKLNGHEETF